MAQVASENKGSPEHPGEHDLHYKDWITQLLNRLEMNHLELKLFTSVNFTKDGDVDYSNHKVIDLPWYPAYGFERMDWQSVLKFVGRHQHYAFVASAIYLVTIFGIQHFMKNRKAFDLKRELVWWNGALGIFSIVGFFRVLPGFIYQLMQPNGAYQSLCVLNGGSPQEFFWLLAFLFSKYVELGDTIFIALRKRPLQVLQWFHHVATLTACWIMAPYAEPFIRHSAIMNYGVHSLMYPYFALRALDVKVPDRVANLITTLQFAQMLVGFYVNGYSAYMYYFGSSPCYRHPNSLTASSFAYGTFVILFGKLFYQLVVNKAKSKKKDE